MGQALRLNAELRKRLVACGVSAGFASVFGTPIAGAIYGVWRCWRSDASGTTFSFPASWRA